MNWFVKTGILTVFLFIPLILSGKLNCPIYAEQSLFDYDQSSPLQISESGIKSRGPAKIHEITYSSPGMEREVAAHLVVPSRKGVKAPFAGIIFLHKYPGWNDQFLDEAVALAEMGAVSLLIDGYFPWWDPPKSLTDDCKSISRQITELRRGVDLLIARQDVDVKRIAYVGMDYGAMHGSVLAGVEKRIKAFVLIAGTTRYHLWSSYWIPNESSSKTYQEGTSPMDPITGISRASAPILFQFSTTDRFIPAENAKELFAAAHEPKLIQWYNSNHESIHEISRPDRDEWLRDQLSLPDQKK